MKSVEFNWINRKELNIPKTVLEYLDFILLLTEDDSVLNGCSTSFVPSTSCLLTVFLEKDKSVY